MSEQLAFPRVEPQQVAVPVLGIGHRTGIDGRDGPKQAQEHPGAPQDHEVMVAAGRVELTTASLKAHASALLAKGAPIRASG